MNYKWAPPSFLHNSCLLWSAFYICAKITFFLLSGGAEKSVCVCVWGGLSLWENMWGWWCICFTFPAKDRSVSKQNPKVFPYSRLWCLPEVSRTPHTHAHLALTAPPTLCLLINSVIAQTLNSRCTRDIYSSALPKGRASHRRTALDTEGVCLTFDEDVQLVS